MGHADQAAVVFGVTLVVLLTGFFQSIRHLWPGGSIISTTVRTSGSVMVKYLIITQFQGFGHTLTLGGYLPTAPSWML